MNWRLVAIPITLIPIFIIAIQFDIQIDDDFLLNESANILTDIMLLNKNIYLSQAA